MLLDRILEDCDLEQELLDLEQEEMWYGSGELLELQHAFLKDNFLWST